MNIKYIRDKKQAQFELFPNESWRGQGDLKRGFCRSITLSIESIIVLCIGLVMGGVWIFSLGVERGKRIGIRDGYDKDGIALNVDSNARRWNIALVDVDRNKHALAPERVVRNSDGIKTIADEKNKSGSVTMDGVEISSGKRASQIIVSPQDGDKAEIRNDAVQTNKMLEKDSKRYYTIQVASFKKEKNAKIEAERLKGIGVDIFVLPKGEYSIVCIGRFLKKADAREFSQKIKDRYKDYLIRRL